MGTFLILIAIAGLIYLLLPAVRLFRQVRRVQREQQDFWRSFTGGAASEGASAPFTRRAPRRMKIDASVGEYVEFEEIPGSHSSPAPSPFTPEQQISDADFEEIQ